MPTTIGAILLFLSVFVVGILWATRDETPHHGNEGEHGETH
jgi:hypothetical protein